MAVRRMLLRALSGSVANSITTATGPSVLRSTGRVASSPDELGDGDALGQAVRLLQSSAGQASATVLRGGTLDDALQVSKRFPVLKGESRIEAVSTTPKPAT